MRIDKFFSEMGIFSRKECAEKLKKGLITVNGETVKKGEVKIDPEKDEVCLSGERINYKKFVYILVNKPTGVVSATEDGRDKTVIDLLPDSFKRLNLFPCGRLDKDTVGLVILTNDGVSAHKRLAPKTHAEKVYVFETAENITDSDVATLQQGVTLKDGLQTQPCKIKLTSSKSGEITLTEGKYHEIKRMFGYTGNKITYLKRISFAGINLDGNLKEGECRPLTEEEIALFTL